jgi:hypothetical protein
MIAKARDAVRIAKSPHTLIRENVDTGEKDFSDGISYRPMEKSPASGLAALPGEQWSLPGHVYVEIDVTGDEEVEFDDESGTKATRVFLIGPTAADVDWPDGTSVDIDSDGTVTEIGKNGWITSKTRPKPQAEPESAPGPVPASAPSPEPALSFQPSPESTDVSPAPVASQQETSGSPSAPQATEVTQGQTPDQVVAILGPPISITTGPAPVYNYPHLSIVFARGKVWKIHQSQ